MHGTLGRAEAGAGGVRARRAAAEQGLELKPAAAAATMGRAAGAAAAAAAARGGRSQWASLDVPPGARHCCGRPGPQYPAGCKTGSQPCNLFRFRTAILKGRGEGTARGGL